MGQKLKQYILSLQTVLESGGEIQNIESLKAELLTEISFWQHERLIHLLVTILFAILTMAVFMVLLFYRELSMLILLAALLCLMIPYIRHYYILENGVQTLYTFYEELTKRQGNIPVSCVPALTGVKIRSVKQ